MAQKKRSFTKEKAQLLQSLLTQGKRKGYIQADTIKSRFSRYSPSAEELEGYLQQFKDAGIDVLYADPFDIPCDEEQLEEDMNFDDIHIPKPDSVSSSLADPLQLYLNEIHKYPTLSYKETLALVHKIKNGDMNAREYLINCNLKFAYTIALKYLRSGLPLLDLVQQANLGLTIAADRYSPNHGTRFTSYAVFWIRQSILVYINETSRLIRLPEDICFDISKLYHLETAFFADHQRNPTDDELATLSGFPIARIKYIRSLDFNIISTEAQPDEEMEGTIENTLTNFESDDDEHKEFFQNECRAMLLEFLMKLTARQRDVLILRFGLDPELAPTPLTLEETGKILGITRERVRQLESLALSNLRRMPGITMLYSYLEL